MKTPAFFLLFRFAIGGLTLLAAPSMAAAGEADVVGVRLQENSSGVYRFHVTVRHGDEGWDHYADRWEVLDGQGRVLGTRVLAHPHADEQPFTRSGEITVPADIDRVRVRAHDKRHGFGGKEMEVEIPR